MPRGRAAQPRQSPGPRQPGIDPVPGGDDAAAAALFTEAIALDPYSAEPHINLGSLLFQRGDLAAAAAQFTEAIRLDPDIGEAYNNLAMLLASCPDPRFRDGPRAIENATRACELTHWSRPDTLDTLAAAHAEVGDFAAAIARQEQAIDMLPDGPRKDDYRTRLALYRAGKPYQSPLHSPSPAPSAPGR